MRRLTKVRVILDFHLANVAHKGTTGASHLVATVTLNDGLFAFGTFSDHRVRDGFFDSKTTLGLNFFFDFVATANEQRNVLNEPKFYNMRHRSTDASLDVPQRNVRRFATFTAR